MKLLFVGVACSDAVIRESAARYYGGRLEVRPQQYFDFALVRGLAESWDVSAVSEPPVATFPTSRCLFYRRRPEQVSGNLRISYLSVLNVSGFKTAMVALQVFLRTLAFCYQTRGQRAAVLMGYISIHTALPAIAVSRGFGMAVFAMVPDLPRLAATYGRVGSRLKRLAVRGLAALTRYVEPRFDGYVFLAPAMDEVVNRKQRPSTVMEGLFDAGGLPLEEECEKEPRQTVMYAGTLHSRFGIASLVEAFRRPELQGVDLWVFGNGDYLERLQQISAACGNVIYKGVVSRADAFRYERRATLLVNPRPTSDALTRYSFPSKTLEYMASGTPLVAARLAGIPSEYSQYLYWFDDESPRGMARRIAELLAEPRSTIAEMGERARAFVLRHKTASRQAAKVRAFLEGLC